jgi:hypothetical protein
MLVLGGVEQLTDDAVVQIDDFIRHRGRALKAERHQRCIASLASLDATVHLFQIGSIERRRIAK